MPQICNMGPTALLPFRRKVCWGFFHPEKSWRLRLGLNPRTWVLKRSTLPLDHWSRFHLLYLLYFLDIQHVSGINMSIFRSLRLCCWTAALAVLFCNDGEVSNNRHALLATTKQQNISHRTHTTKHQNYANANFSIVTKQYSQCGISTT